MSVAAAKIGAGFSAVLGMSGLVQTHTFSNALLGFMAAGIIPGTDIKISADVMLVISTLVMGVVLSLVFRRALLALGQVAPRLYRGLIVVAKLTVSKVRPLYKRAYSSLKHSVISEVNTLSILGRRYTQRGIHTLKPWAAKAISYLSPR